MHETDTPEGIKWGNYISLSANKRKITCKVLSNAMAEIRKPREHQISINKHLKSRLNIKSGATVDFYVKKASRLKTPYYVARYHPDKAVRRVTFWKMFGVSILLAAVTTIVALYFLLWQ